MLLVGKIAISRQSDLPAKVWRWQCIEDPPEIILLFSKASREVGLARNSRDKPRACVHGSQASFSFSISTAAYRHDSSLIEWVLSYEELFLRARIGQIDFVETGDNIGCFWREQLTEKSTIARFHEQLRGWEYWTCMQCMDSKHRFGFL
jgi:hypothetical protein